MRRIIGPVLNPLRLIPLILLIAAAPTRAAEAAPELAGSIGQLVLGLAVVVGLLLGTLWLLKRVSSPRGAASGLRVLGAVPVGPRERVVLVEIADSVLVLGVAPGSVRTLHTLPADTLVRDAGAVAGPAKAGGGDFAAWLRKSMERGDHAR
jgi:flagellar protein FliO/FliZ